MKKSEFVFIHIYKNAGTSVTNALIPHSPHVWSWHVERAIRYSSYRWSLNFKPMLRKCRVPMYSGLHPFPGHMAASDVISEVGQAQFDSMFSFAFVRNPWDWQVSLYKYMLKNKTHPQHHLVTELGDFESYVDWRCDNEIELQKDYIYSLDNELLVDFVGKFESLEKDFEKVCSRIGVNVTLPRLNVSNTVPYQDYYSNNARKKIESAYSEDIALLGYEF